MNVEKSSNNQATTILQINKVNDAKQRNTDVKMIISGTNLNQPTIEEEILEDDRSFESESLGSS